MKTFRDLLIWQKAMTLVTNCYSVSTNFPKEEQFGLTSQTIRSAASITANIAEGSARVTFKDQARFYMFSYSSGVELINHLIIAKELEYINDDEYTDLRNKLERITYSINNLRKSILQKNNSKT